MLIILLSRNTAVGSPADLSAGRSEQELKVVVVQFRVEQSMIGSPQAYGRRIGQLVEKALVFQPDLIVFPEYAAAFTALIPHHQALRGSETISEALLRIQAGDPLIADLRDLFLLNSGFSEALIRKLFGSLAREHSVFILAGSYFAWQAGPAGEVQLRNRALLFGPQGNPVYTQDKVYLTEFELELLRLSPGTLEQAAAFDIRDHRVGLTICRDTFFPDWEEHWAGIDLWVDIKANGVPYTPQQQESFGRALPARIQAGEVPFGITACLTGSLLDLLWEGESSLVGKQGASIHILKRSLSPRREEVIPMRLAFGGN